MLKVNEMAVEKANTGKLNCHETAITSICADGITIVNGVLKCSKVIQDKESIKVEVITNNARKIKLDEQLIKNASIDILRP